jgi:citronellol/citronellal dehydrogenase
MESALSGKILFITGASRGIGLAIALRAAKDGARVAIAAKTVEPHPSLPGTIYSAAKEIQAAGGEALPLPTDIRFEEQVAAAVEQTVKTFGGIDILVNNASAIQLTSADQTELRRYDLMHGINQRGTFLCSKLCAPHLKRADNPHVLTLAPPISLNPRWFARHTAYTTSKFGMALTSLGLAAEYRPAGIAFNCLWPKTVIKTAALAMIPGIDPSRCRKPEIVADAAYEIFRRPARDFSGNFCLDEEILRETGITDFSRYAVDPATTPFPDLFVE